MHIQFHFYDPVILQFGVELGRQDEADALPDATWSSWQIFFSLRPRKQTSITI